jgi:maltose alpha-D-glucosyltransferase/alpha-amylase
MNARTDQFAWKSDPLWYKDAIIYELHIRAFFDSNNDGIGDLCGLTDKLGYLQELGINTIWLLPFYPSPMRDDGYDISDYRNVHSDYGTLSEFKEFVREAHRRGIKVITELVINHTSDQHSWFQAARQAPAKSAKRKFYLWSDTDTKFPETRIIFTDTEGSNWSWDCVARAYYWHRFFSHQPDLNHNNPQVVKAMARVMRFWLDIGVDGLRLDAIPYLCVREGTNNENLPETHEVIKQLRAIVEAHYDNRIFLAEANQWPEDTREYFGDGDECHMAYHFPLMPRMYMAVAQEDRHPIVEIMTQTPEIPLTCQWAIFLRNHDELTLEMVTDRERDYMYQMYAADSRMRLNVGIRRRLAPLMDNNPDKIKLLNSLLMSMPGSPIIYYGDEIGMGDNFFLGDRNGVRTPMQWSSDRNAGFSKADPQCLYLPPIMDPIHGYQAVNVEAQSRDPSSLLNWMKRIIAIRKTYKAFSRGTLHFLHPGNRKIFVYIRRYEDEIILCVANLSRFAQPVELDLAEFRGYVAVELMGHTAFPPIGDFPYLLTLPGHGVYWFRLSTEVEVPSWHEEHLPPMELPVLVLIAGWDSFFPQRIGHLRQPVAVQLHNQLQKEILPQFLPTQRWFAAKGEVIAGVEFDYPGEWTDAQGTWLPLRLKVHLGQSGTQYYFLPLALVWSEDDERIHELLHAVLAKVRQRAQVGVLCDAFADQCFCQALVRGMGENQRIPLAEGQLEFSATRAYAKLVGEPGELTMRQPSAAGSNTSVILGDRVFLKGYRRLQEGLNPELEMERFLTEVSPFPHIAPLAGALEFKGRDGSAMTLALLQGFIPTQDDGWTYTINYLERFFEKILVAPQETRQNVTDAAHDAYLMLMTTLGQRTGELHQALAKYTGDAAFDPEPITQDDLSAWREQILHEATSTLDSLAQSRARLADRLQAHVDELLASKAALLNYISDPIPRTVEAIKARYHGDYHLGQVLVAENDFIIIDFEGEPARPLTERRLKRSPLKDVAGMLRSFDYAAYVGIERVTIERAGDVEILQPFALDWARRASAAFLNGYLDVAQGSVIYPRAADHSLRLIGLLSLEKVFYELRYELANRPVWAEIPLKGLLDFIKANLSGTKL